MLSQSGGGEVGVSDGVRPRVMAFGSTSNYVSAVVWAKMSHAHNNRLVLAVLQSGKMTVVGVENLRRSRSDIFVDSLDEVTV